MSDPTRVLRGGTTIALKDVDSDPVDKELLRGESQIYFLKGSGPRIKRFGQPAENLFIASVQDAQDSILQLEKGVASGVAPLDAGSLVPAIHIPPTLPLAHDLGGAEHTADTLTNLNSKVSDAILAGLDDAAQSATTLYSSNKIQSIIDLAVAATVVVKGGGTDVELQAAFDALPAEGGTIYAEGTFAISTTITVPDKPVVLVGGGRDVTIFDLGSSGIAAFTDAFDNPNAYRDFSIYGDDTTLLQKGVDYTFAGSALVAKNFVRVDFGGSAGVTGKNIFRSVDAGTGSQKVHFTDCISRNRAGTETDSAFFFGDGEIRFLRCESFTSSIIEDGSTLNVFIQDCPSIDITGTHLQARQVHLRDSQFTGDKTIESGLNGGSAIGCLFLNNVPGGSVLDLSLDIDSRAIGCQFRGTATRALLIGINGQSIGNEFQQGTYTTDVYVNAKTNVTVIGDGKTVVEEVGAANFNRYTNISPSSTILGDFTKVNGAYLRTVAPAVGDDVADFVEVGDRWIDTVAKKTYICLSNAVGAADWDRTNGGGGGTQIKTGSYTGDGTTSQAVTGIGFLPKYVKIWDRQTVDNTNIAIFETTPDIMDDNANGGVAFHRGAGDHRFLDNAIISLDADGFTVDDDGVDGPPNTSGNLYNYLAMG